MAAALSGQAPPDRVGSGLRRALERRLRDGWVAVATRQYSAAWERQPLCHCSTMLRLFGPDEEGSYLSATNDLDDTLQR